ncbi:alpha/beta hydrolase family protein [Pedobacter miscanthi]|uniref:alpha/beta fold hydrolase n=1 Tax=Pedobacter miscanthi TaxID=2259170 RepID=UPI00292E42E3|nr:alpha/beta hydrolase family protein [Pedobacter miscanthi]
MKIIKIALLLTIAYFSLYQAVANGTNMAKMNTVRLNADSSYTVEAAISRDGTKIGYWKYGHGPGLIIVQGAMGTAYHYNELAIALAKYFTVYVPDRRGRGMSYKSYNKDHTIDRDVEDLQCVIEKTGAHLLFGLSSGAIIALETTRITPTITKTVLYEPPFYVDGLPVKKISLINKEINENHYPAALVTIFQATKVGPAVFNFLPNFILRSFTSSFLKSEAKNGTGLYAPVSVLIPSTRYDFKVVLDRGSKVQIYNTVNQEILLLGGSNSPAYLKKSLSELEKVLPNRRRTEFKGLDHSGPWNAAKGGRPEIIAGSMVTFYNGE